jgi:hypothetical protein
VNNTAKSTTELLYPSYAASISHTMFTTKTIASRALSRASRQVRGPTTRRQYATDYEKRTQETLKTSSRLTWYAFMVSLRRSLRLSASEDIMLIASRLTTAAAVGAAAIYYTTSASPAPMNEPSTSASNISSSSKPTSSNSSSSNGSDSKPGHRHEAAYASDVPKPVEDRHGDTVSKHSIAAHKNQDKLRVGKFSGEEFDNHELEHTPGKPGGDFEKKR